MKANEVTAGQKVIANGGYPGTIAKVCEWSRARNEQGEEGVMVEVRLASGLVCVCASGLVRL